KSPKALIGRPPYKACPKCEEISFGVLLNLNDNKSYFKKCHECWHEEYIKIPKLNKKIIYLDQFVISNIYKSLNKTDLTKGGLEYFKQLYKKINCLIEVNAVACPNSNVHFDESVMDDRHRAFIKLYTQLSAEVRLADTDII